jgi:beta-glucosidase
MLGALLFALSSLSPMAAQSLLPYQNPALTADERAADLLARLSTEEKIQLMMNDSPALPRWGIAAYNWWSEGLHGCARAGLATVFPQAIGMAATFHPELVQQAYDITSSEQRIKYVQARRHGEVTRYHGLTIWTPNINIFRDPRWGRGQETYGEDPYLTTCMGRAAVTGLQNDTQGEGYDKAHACLKHYAVHSGPEYSRHTFDARDLSLRDLAETYLYAFENLVRTTDVKEVMCAYNRVEGAPCCGSNQLLIQILRNEWGYDGLVVTDCNAVRNFFTPEPKGHGTHPDEAAASADAVLNGTDLECGAYFKHLPEALQRGAIDTVAIDRSVRRVLKARFELGEMDADSLVSWNHIDEGSLASEQSDAVALQLARESMVLLQNRGDVLPLQPKRKGLTYAVLGPNSDNEISPLGNYNGTPRHTVSVVEGIRARMGKNDRLITRKVSECVARQEFVSRYAQCSGEEGGVGVTARYWNNTKREGAPAAVVQMAQPFQLCTSGATVFAPGVNLEDFAATYTTTYRSEQDETLLLDLFVCGQGRVVVNGKEIGTFKTGHGSRRYQRNINVRRGEQYDIRVEFEFLINDAQFNFDLGVTRPTDLAEVLHETQDADVYIYVGGISPQLEGEEMKVDFEGFKGGDRTEIELPAVQRETLQALHATGKPVVFVNFSGSAIALEPETSSCDAIVQAWYGGQEAGRAVADVLFGAYNPSGRLPITFYRNLQQLPDYNDYSMAGRTYRYLQSAPLYPFGYGLSYTTFSYGMAAVSQPASGTVQLDIPVSNRGKRDGEEVVQVYVRRVGDTAGPKYALRAFRRVAIAAGKKAVVSFTLDGEAFRTFSDETGRMEVLPGEYEVLYGPNSDRNSLQSVSVTL